MRKSRPAWQKGRMNGPGGKVEPGEEFLAAMVREFKEETGLDVPAESWRHTITQMGPDYELRFYSTCAADLRQARTTTDEPLFVLRVDNLHKLNVIPNLRWMIPLCLDTDVKHPVLVQG